MLKIITGVNYVSPVNASDHTRAWKWNILYRVNDFKIVQIHIDSLSNISSIIIFPQYYDFYWINHWIFFIKHIFNRETKVIYPILRVVYDLMNLPY